MADFIGLFGERFEEEDYDESLANIEGVTEPQEGYLPPEPSDGNIEYKLKLVTPSPSRFEHLVTQMKWRLREGHGEAIYELGVEDKGMMVGLSEDEATASLQTLYMMSEKLGASLSVLRERQIFDEHDQKMRRTLEVLVRKVPEDQDSVELRVAVLGNIEVGKSTLLGVLTHGELDNGRGSSRLNLFRHRHEIQSGRTSSISREILGFSSDGNPLTYSTYRSPEEICEAASKLITFIDLAGHHKYLRTTVFGLIGHLPHLVLLLVSAVSGVVGTTKEHLSLAKALDLPVVVIVSKTDLVSDAQLEQTKDVIDDTLKTLPYKRVPLRMANKDDVLTATSCVSDSSVTPVFYVSSLTGKGLDLLYLFLNVLPPRLSARERDQLLQRETEFQVDETFQIPGVGSVVGGLLMSGVIRSGDKMSVGPFEDGHFEQVAVTSVHRNRVPCRVVRAGESATLALESSKGDNIVLRRGMVLLPSLTSKDTIRQFTCVYFQARIHVLNHPRVISPGLQTTAFIGNTRQTVVVVALMGKKSISNNESASAMLRFLRQPEFVKPGARILLRDSCSKAVGHVIQVFPLMSSVHES